MNSNELNTETLVADLKRVVHDSEDLIKASAGVIGEKAQELREHLAQTIESAKTTCGHLQERTVEGAKAADTVIREHPYQSIGAAFGIGLLIGVLVTRK